MTLPLVPGVDPSGVIVKLGDGVTHRKVGDRVTVALRLGNRNSGADALRLLGVHAWGGYAEYVRALAVNTTIVPDNVDFPVATVVRAMRRWRSTCCRTTPRSNPANGCW